MTFKEWFAMRPTKTNNRLPMSEKDQHHATWHARDPEIARLRAALRKLLKAGPCDLCYEDNCDSILCECSCHREEDAAVAWAEDALTDSAKE